MSGDAIPVPEVELEDPVEVNNYMRTIKLCYCYRKNDRAMQQSVILLFGYRLTLTFVNRV